MRKSVVDMIGREIAFEFPPKRIVSLVPSQTELLCDLGLEDEVVGITKFCVHPEAWFRSKERIGGTKKLNIEKIRALAPDLIIANKEENERPQIEELIKEFPVWTSDIREIPSAFEMIRAVSGLVDKESAGVKLLEDIQDNFSLLKNALSRKRVAYFIWYRPWMSAGGDTFISHMIEAAGWINVLKEETRYPEITLEKLPSYEPELVLLSSEPFPFKKKHIEEVKALLPQAEVLLVDGEMFSWYGSRMLQATKYLSELTSQFA